MKPHIYRIVCLWLWLAATLTAGAQQGLDQLLPDGINIFKTDSVDAAEDTDSARLAQANAQLAEAQLAEANLRMELEQMRMQYESADSLRLEQQRQRIDSLRTCTAGVPVVVEGDTLFCVYALNGSMTPQERAKRVTEEVNRIGKSFAMRDDTLRIDVHDEITLISNGKDIIMGLTDADAMWAGTTRAELARTTCSIIEHKLEQMRKEHGFWTLVKRLVMFVIVCFAFYVAVRLLNYFYRKLRRRLPRLLLPKLKPLTFNGLELLNTRKQMRVVVWFTKMLRNLLILLLLLITVPMIFAIFPQTKNLAYNIFSYIWDPIYSILIDVINYIPNLFTIAIIYLVIKYLVRFCHYLANEVQEERLTIKGFYPDWAQPTYYIVRFLLYAFMIAMIYPYLPGSSSGVFQGISVFIGLIVSLGSSTVIGNIIAGLVITYMRPFQLGDRIKLSDTVGNVIEKTPLVTRIKTPKNEIVTVPNSFVMSNQSVNYSSSARTFGLILHTEVTIGYDVPWRKVHKLLTEAALATKGIEREPAPFVLETGLSDYYPVYQLNAYTTEADRMGEIYSELHQNIQDTFRKADVEIMSPQYIATRDGNASTIPAE